MERSRAVADLRSHLQEAGPPRRRAAPGPGWVQALQASPRMAAQRRQLAACGLALQAPRPAWQAGLQREAPARSWAPPTVQLLTSPEAGKVRWMITELHKYHDIPRQETEALFQRVIKLDDVFEALLEVRGFVGRLMSEHVDAEVSKPVLLRLQQADAAIRFAKASLPWGAGNQLDAAFLSSGNSTARAKAVKSGPAFGQEQIDPSPAAVAEQAAVAMGGTCREYAALALQYLRGVTEDPLCIRSVKHPMEHTFVVIGDPKDPATAVVADPWPTLAQAVLLKDHFVSKSDLVRGTLDAADTRPAAKVVVNQPDKLATDLAAQDDQMPQDLIGRQGMNFAPGNARGLRFIRYHSGKADADHGLGLHSEWDAAPALRSKEQEQARLEPLAPRQVASSSAAPYEDTGKAIVYRGKTYEYAPGNVEDESIHAEILGTIGKIEASDDPDVVKELLESLDGYCD